RSKGCRPKSDAMNRILIVGHERRRLAALDPQRRGRADAAGRGVGRPAATAAVRLEIAGIDYVIAEDGGKHLPELLREIGRAQPARLLDPAHPGEKFLPVDLLPRPLQLRSGERRRWLAFGKLARHDRPRCRAGAELYGSSTSAGATTRSSPPAGGAGSLYPL